MKIKRIKSTKKLTCGYIILGLLFIMQISEVSAQALPPSYNSIAYQNSENISPRSDVLVYRYRTKNGHRERRLWNETKRKWAQPNWERY